MKRLISINKFGVRFMTCMLIAAVLVIGSGSGIVQAGQPRMLTGETYFYEEQWGGVEIWSSYSIHEVDPMTGAVKGAIYVTVYNPWMDATKSLVYVPECVKFEENTVTIVVEIIAKTGVGTGEVGEHAKWQFKDGGAPGIGSDSFTIINFQLDPWIEYWPVGAEAPTCVSFDPVPGWEEPIYPDAGNLTIH